MHWRAAARSYLGVAWRGAASLPLASCHRQLRLPERLPVRCVCGLRADGNANSSHGRSLRVRRFALLALKFKVRARHVAGAEFA